MKVNEIISEGKKSINIVRILSDSIREFTRTGHTEIDTPAFLNTMIEKTGTSFTLEDLINANNEFEAISRQIDTIDPRKIKFSKNVTTVKNDNAPQKDPAVEQQKLKQKNQATVSNMASRALG